MISFQLDRKCVDYQFPESFQVSKHQISKSEKSFPTEFKIPDFDRVAELMTVWSSYANNEEWAQEELNEACFELQNWIALLNCGATS